MSWLSSPGIEPRSQLLLTSTLPLYQVSTPQSMMWDPIIMICLTFQGLKKQEAWMDNIRSIMDERGSGLDSDVRRLLETIIKFDNIPRKRNKFINFVQVRLLARSKTRCLVTSIPRSFPRLMCLCFHCSFTSLYNKCITVGRWIVIWL